MFKRCLEFLEPVKITGITKEAMDIMLNYSFPGNVRELENIIERAIILENPFMITPESIPSSIRLLQIETLDPDKLKTVVEAFMCRGVSRYAT